MKLFPITRLLAVWAIFLFCETKGSNNGVKSDMISKGTIHSKNHDSSNQSNIEITGNTEFYTPGEQYADVNGTTAHLRIVHRIIWVAQPPSGPKIGLTLPVSTVIIHHTNTKSCSTQADCILQTRKIQTFNMETRLNDIEYNFLIGGSGAVYEGRGWKVEGEHTLGVNDKSYGVAFIGTFSEQPPPRTTLPSLAH
uniref:Peptidoglycan-recognition protein LF-like n=1 Tax=Diabrotica virgifera virgifera TaxID=50390 RepID=A0A6P7G4T0_DIAVI